MSVKQNTLKAEFSLKGKGLHTGKEVCATFKPAEENCGYRIIRTDIEGRPVIPALAAYVQFVDRASCLEKEGVKIFTMEHAMAALYGCGVDNCDIELDGEEFPILDGSSRFYVEAIEKVGLQEQNAERQYFEVTEKMEFACEATQSKIILLPDTEYSINLVVAYDSPYLSMQYATYDSHTNFVKEIAPCRTFVFLREVEALFANNLIKGGDLQNAIVIVDKEISEEEVKRLSAQFGYEGIEVKQGILNNLDLYFDNEPARHKLLDVMGDLALCGRFIKGRVIAERPGHKVNTAMAQKIYKAVLNAEKEDAYPADVDIMAEPLMDINKIRMLLPHRPPFLLIDKIYKVTNNVVIGCKNVTMNEPFFVGHFPDEPVMPGVLIVEAMSQCGGILVLNQVPDPENYSTYFMKIDGVKFRKKVVPGDTLVFKLITLAPVKRGIVTMKGYAFVGKKLVCEGEFMAQVAKTKN